MNVNSSLSIQSQTNTNTAVVTKKNNSSNSQSVINSLTLKNVVNLNPDLKKSGSIPAVSSETKDCTKHIKEEVNCLDNLVNATGIVGNTANVGGILITVPGETIKHASAIKKLSNIVTAGSMVNIVSSTPASVNEKIYLSVAKSALKVARASEGVSVIATKLHYENVSGFTSKKVLPAINVLLSGVSIYTNTKRYNKAKITKNKLEMAKASTQIVLSSVSAATGYMPGKGQVISAVTGISTLFSDKLIDGANFVYHKIKK